MAAIKRANPTPRDIASARKKEHIYKCALELFKEYGYESVTIKDIAAHSGMSEGSIYNFFGSKNGILAKTYDYIVTSSAEYITQTEEHLADPRGTIYNYLMHSGAVYVSLGWEIVLKYHSSLQFPFRTGENDGGLEQSLSKSMLPDLYAFLEEATRRGRIAPKLPPETVTVMLSALCTGVVVNWASCEGKFDLLAETGKLVLHELELLGI